MSIDVEKMQRMATTEESSLPLTGPAGSAVLHDVPSVCADEEGKATPPVEPLATNGDTLVYEINPEPSAVTPIIATSLDDPALTSLAAQSGMPEELFRQTVCQFGIWHATGTSGKRPFTRASAQSHLARTLERAGRKAPPEQLEQTTNSIWEGVTITQVAVKEAGGADGILIDDRRSGPGAVLAELAREADSRAGSAANSTAASAFRAAAGAYRAGKRAAGDKYMQAGDLLNSDHLSGEAEVLWNEAQELEATEMPPGPAKVLPPPAGSGVPPGASGIADRQSEHAAESGPLAEFRRDDWPGVCWGEVGSPGSLEDKVEAAESEIADARIRRDDKAANAWEKTVSSLKSGALADAVLWSYVGVNLWMAYDCEYRGSPKAAARWRDVAGHVERGNWEQAAQSADEAWAADRDAFESIPVGGPADTAYDQSSHASRLANSETDPKVKKAYERESETAREAGHAHRRGSLAAEEWQRAADAWHNAADARLAGEHSQANAFEGAANFWEQSASAREGQMLAASGKSPVPYDSAKAEADHAAQIAEEQEARARRR